MIIITQLLARQLASVFRRAFKLTPRRNQLPIHLVGSADGLRITAALDGVVISYHLARALPDAQLVVPFGLLKACQGSTAHEVRIVPHSERDVIASWTDGALPRESAFEVPENVVIPVSARPTEFRHNPPALLKALHAAVETTDSESSRYALGMIQLRGRDGAILATDGRQALVQRGFDFGWEEEALISGSLIFTCKELASSAGVEIGKTEDHVVIRVGPWTVQLAVEKARRFPRIDDIIPLTSSARASISLNTSDAAFLLANLSRLPTPDAVNDPVTLDANGTVVARFRSDDQLPPTDFVLSRSTKEGFDVRVGMNRKYLIRAATLGFNSLYVQDARSPVMAADDRRAYIWALLDASMALGPSTKATIVTSSTKRDSSRRHRRPQMVQESNRTTGRVRPSAASPLR